jgi:hypothetical protein
MEGTSEIGIWRDQNRGWLRIALAIHVGKATEEYTGAGGFELNVISVQISFKANDEDHYGTRTHQKCPSLSSSFPWSNDSASYVQPLSSREGSKADSDC